MTSAELEYNNAWSANVTQQTDITVLGEDFTPDAVDADKLITINVTASELRQCFGYKSNWNPLTTDAEGEQPLPELVFRLESVLGTKLNNVHLDLMSKTGLAANQRTFKDDIDNDISSFARVFLQEVQFTGSVFDTDIPKVAIRSIDEQDAVATQLASIVGDIDTMTGSNTVIAALRSLFEQAVAANRIRYIGSEQYTVDGVTYKSPSFQAGDSLTFYVDYSFIKTRSYTVDTDLSQVSNVRAAIVALSIGGQTFSINTASTETSDTLTKRYAFKLLVSTSPSKWDPPGSGGYDPGNSSGGTSGENGLMEYNLDMAYNPSLNFNVNSRSLRLYITNIPTIEMATVGGIYNGLILSLTQQDIPDPTIIVNGTIVSSSISGQTESGTFYQDVGHVSYRFNTPQSSLPSPFQVDITLSSSVPIPTGLQIFIGEI